MCVGEIQRERGKSETERKRISVRDKDRDIKRVRRIREITDGSKKDSKVMRKERESVCV